MTREEQNAALVKGAYGSLADVALSRPECPLMGFLSVRSNCRECPLSASSCSSVSSATRFAGIRFWRIPVDPGNRKQSGSGPKADVSRLCLFGASS